MLQSQAKQSPSEYLKAKFQRRKLQLGLLKQENTSEGPTVQTSEMGGNFEGKTDGETCKIGGKENVSDKQKENDINYDLYKEMCHTIN